MNSMNFQESWAFLDALQFFKIKLGLDSMNHFLEHLNNPHRTIPFVHIGGTNGKGSVGSNLLSILSQAGYRVGFYTSPHLSSVRERFRINDQYISEDDFAREANKIINVLGDDQITYFEFTTTLAFLWFASENVDLAILEVGMGGRLDATNIITPLVSVITNVSMDHEQYLGNTLEEISTEKAGIIKTKVPVVSGATDNVPQEIIKKTCSSKQSPLMLLERDFLAKPTNNTWQYTQTNKDDTITPWDLRNLPISLGGNYQISNAALSIATLNMLQSKGFPVSEQHIRNGLDLVRWPGRLEEFWETEQNEILHQQPEINKETKHYLLDGAHNSAGINALCEALSQSFPRDKLILIWAAMADKDLNKTLPVIAPLADTIILTQPENERSATPEQLKETLPDNLQENTYCLPDIKKALAHATNTANANDLICIAGSLYLIGAVRQSLLGDLV